MTPDVRGVAFTAPPVSILSEATRILDTITQQLPANAHGAVVVLATTSGWNAAVVHRVGDRFHVGTWIAKSWGSGLTGGAAIRATW